jgi:hypothetical protein
MVTSSQGGSKDETADTLGLARSYVKAGLSVIPIRHDGSKAPSLPQGHPILLRERTATDQELVQWFGGKCPAGIGVQGGPISGGVEDCDFDDPRLFDPWARLVESECPELPDRLSVIATPRPGFAVVYRCTEIVMPGSEKLAVDESDKTLIETRAAGGYFLVPGCPGACHETGHPYEHFSGPPLTDLAIVTAAEREVLLRCARSFDRRAQQEKPPPQGGGSGQLRPGDDFNLRGPSFEALLPGWTVVLQRTDGVRYLRRPGKARGWSATTGLRSKAGHELFCCFSSNAAPFEGASGGRPCTSYSRFGVYTLLLHDGDFAASARALAAQGYGDQTPRNNGGTKGPKTGTGQQAPSPGALVAESLAGCKAQPVKWLIPGRVPLSKLVIIAGDGGHGKSTVTLEIAAAVSQGRCCLGLSYENPIQGSVLLFSCEDDIRDTVVPRLLCHGADLSRVIEGKGVRGQDGKVQPFSMQHYRELEQHLSDNPDIRYVVIDPAGAYVGRAGIDDHKDSELRALLGPLAELAARREVTICLVKHFSKAVGVKAVAKIGGSAGYVNTVRAVYLLLPDDDNDRKLLLPCKFNCGPKPLGIAFKPQALTQNEAAEVLAHDSFSELDAEGLQQMQEQLFRLDWLGEVDVSADEAVEASEKKAKGPNQVEKCTDWLEKFLTPYAWPSDEVKDAAAEQGFSFGVLKRAKTALKEQRGGQYSKWGRFNGVWWCGIGDPTKWQPRPTPSSTSDSSSTSSTSSSSSTSGAPLHDDPRTDLDDLDDVDDVDDLDEQDEVDDQGDLDGVAKSATLPPAVVEARAAEDRAAAESIILLALNRCPMTAAEITQECTLDLVVATAALERLHAAGRLLAEPWGAAGPCYSLLP